MGLDSIDIDKQTGDEWPADRNTFKDVVFAMVLGLLLAVVIWVLCCAERTAS